jgi:hypothetical protein
MRCRNAVVCVEQLHSSKKATPRRTRETRMKELKEENLSFWLPTSGNSGGLLLGFMPIYGPADHNHSTAFLQEPESVVGATNHPIMVRGFHPD